MAGVAAVALCASCGTTGREPVHVLAASPASTTIDAPGPVARRAASSSPTTPAPATTAVARSTAAPTTSLPPSTMPPTTSSPPPATAPPTVAEQVPLPLVPSTVAGCHASYSPCVPIASDVDCAGGSGNGPAYTNGPVEVIGPDEYGLDADDDGIGCED